MGGAAMMAPKVSVVLKSDHIVMGRMRRSKMQRTTSDRARRRILLGCDLLTRSPEQRRTMGV